MKEEKGEEAQREVKGKTEEEVSPWEADYELLVCEGLFSEYLEMGESCWINIPVLLHKWDKHSEDTCCVMGCWL